MDSSMVFGLVLLCIVAWILLSAEDSPENDPHNEIHQIRDTACHDVRSRVRRISADGNPSSDEEQEIKMAKKQESVLRLALIDQGENTSIVSMGSVRPSNQDEQWILDEHHKQPFVMVGVRAKTVHAMQLIADIHKEGVSTFEEATGYILAVKDSQRTKEHQAYVDEFCTREIQMLGRHLLASVEVGATNIGQRCIAPCIHLCERKNVDFGNGYLGDLWKATVDRVST